MQVEMEDAITLDRKSFEALAADSRVRILKSLAQRRKTLTELSEEIGLSNSTMKEHLDVLVSAGLAVQMDEGRKWKYYELTKKGKGIFAPPRRELKVLIMLAVSALLVVAAFWNFAAAFGGHLPQDFEGAGRGSGAAFPMLGGAAAPAEKAMEAEGAGEWEEPAIAYGEVASMRTYGGAETMEGAPSPAPERQFPLVEATVVAGSIAIFAFFLAYARRGRMA
ncbi:MAG: winged helix-turn-helix domain-containing protein [Candidatus Bilamarchaeaceae archaeon]